MWKSLYKSEEFLSYTKREWQKGLEKFNQDVLEKAVVHCSEKEPYPPSLPLFIEICKSHLRLPVKASDIEKHQPCDPNVAHQHLEKIRQILNMKHR